MIFDRLSPWQKTCAGVLLATLYLLTLVLAVALMLDAWRF